MEEDEGDDVKADDNNQFAVNMQPRRHPATQDSSRRLESGFKLDIPKFKDCL